MKSYSQALKILKQAKIKIYDEYIKTPKSLNRVSSVNIYSKNDYPSANNASFDGYAINSSDTKGLNKKKTKLFKIIGTIAAGSKPIKKMNKKFRSVEIMTGGLLTKPFNTIIPIEQISFYPNQRKPKFILINKKISRLNDVRLKGSDYKKNYLIFQ